MLGGPLCQVSLPFFDWKMGWLEQEPFQVSHVCRRKELSVHIPRSKSWVGVTRQHPSGGEGHRKPASSKALCIPERTISSTLPGEEVQISLLLGVLYRANLCLHFGKGEGHFCSSCFPMGLFMSWRRTSAQYCGFWCVRG
jgi:hypothetical protein